ncbi:MAG: hypothetical protein AYL28_002190 [Candidatus Bathyarchaeota archaeon B23]|nr:MAG: hypothetical protein AYL28_002190 [Candidatus Bathyarchaeota archaeon B23]
MGEEVRRLLRIREGLEDRIRRLEEELEDLHRALAEVDRLIAHLGFRRAEKAAGAATSVKGKSGVLLGTLRYDEGEIVFEPRGDVEFPASSPPFRAFLLRRLEEMRGRDEDLASRGRLPLEEVLSYDVETDGDRIVRLVVRNYRDERRLREIRSSIRWAFDRMYERMTTGG